MKNISINRKFNLVNAGANYFIYADEKNIGEIKNGQSLNLTIPENSKEIYFGTKWAKSKPIKIEDLKENSIVNIKPNRLSLVGVFLFLAFLIIQIISIFTDREYKYSNLLLAAGLIINMYIQIYKDDNFINIEIIRKKTSYNI